MRPIVPQIEERELDNVRLARADAATLLSRGLPERPLFDQVLVYFPDPWVGSPERRVMRPDVLCTLSARMRPRGVLHFASDVAGYPDDVRALLASPTASGGMWRPMPKDGQSRPSTKYERDAIRAGRPIEDLCYVFEGAYMTNGAERLEEFL